MAEAIGLGSSILGIASFGASVVTTLHKLTTSYRGADAKINSLSLDIALTASILTSLGHTVKEYEVEFHLKADNFIPAREQCEKNFERLSKALRDVRKSDRKDKGATPWKKLMFALGGEDEIKDLMSEIESSKSTLQLLLDSVNLLVLKRLSKNHLLSEDQAEDLKLLVDHLPSLLLSLQRAGLLDAISKPTEANDLGKGPRKEIKLPAKRRSQDLPGLDMGALDVNPDPPEKVEIDRDINDEAGSHQGSRNAGTGDDDNPSESDKEGSSASKKSPDVMVVYEGWLLTRTKDQQNPALVSFCGLNIKIYPSAPDDRFSIVGNSLDQDHLSNMLADNRVSTKVTLKIEDLHSDAQQEIQDLLEDRNENSDLEFEWSLEAIIEISSSNTRKKSIFNRKKNTTKENGIVSKWQVILRGGLRKSPPKVEDLVPTRSSPWGRASRRYQRRGSDIIVRRTAFRKSGRYRAAGSSVSSKETPPRRRTKPIKHTGKHVIATQSVNTGRHGDVVVETRTSRRSSDSEPIPIMEMPAATGNQTTTYAETISLDPNETSRKEEREEAERVMDEYLKTFVNDDDT